MAAPAFIKRLMRLVLATGAGAEARVQLGSPGARRFAGCAKTPDVWGATPPRLAHRIRFEPLWPDDRLMAFLRVSFLLIALCVASGSRAETFDPFTLQLNWLP